jgi:hypothetical protein
VRPGELRKAEWANIDLEAAEWRYTVTKTKIRGYFEAVPALKAMVTANGNDYIELCNNVSIEVHTNNFRAVRGRSLLCVVMDEVAFFRDENFVSPDIEVHAQ